MYSLYNGSYDRGCYEYPTFSTFSLSYWERSLFQRLTTLFHVEGIPAWWDKDAFLYCLYRQGYVTFFESRKYGIIFQPSTPSGIGLLFQPTAMLINSPFFSLKRGLKIGEECANLKLTPDFRGVWDIVTKHAQELQYYDVAIRLALLNARMTYVASVSDDREKASFDALMEKLANAETGVAYNKTMRKNMGNSEEVPWHLFDRDLKKNFILPELQEGRKETISNFYHEIGVRVMPSKKERMIGKEADAYDDETYNRRSVWESSLKESADMVNRMYGLSISIGYNQPKGGEELDTISELNF